MHTKQHLQIINEDIVYYEYKTDKPMKSIVLFCHGFPGGNRLTIMAKPLNDNGITLEEINYRGDVGCDGQFSFFGSMDDIAALTNHLRQQYANIPITALGFSAGGFYISCLVRKQPNLFDKVVLVNPMLDVVQALEHVFLECHVLFYVVRPTLVQGVEPGHNLAV